MEGDLEIGKSKEPETIYVESRATRRALSEGKGAK